MYYFSFPIVFPPYLLLLFPFLVLYLVLCSLPTPFQKYIVLKDFRHILGKPSWRGVVLVRALSALHHIQSVSSTVSCMLRAACSCISALGDIHPP